MKWQQASQSRPAETKPHHVWLFTKNSYYCKFPRHNTRPLYGGSSCRGVTAMTLQLPSESRLRVIARPSFELTTDANHPWALCWDFPIYETDCWLTLELEKGPDLKLAPAALFWLVDFWRDWNEHQIWFL